MRAVIQRVSSAHVCVEGTRNAGIERGLLVLVGVAAGDTTDVAERLARKVASLRIFPNDAGRFDRSVLDVEGAVLVVSQFTLITDSRRQSGARPDFSGAARPEVPSPLYLDFCDSLRLQGLEVATGVFGAVMTVALVNDGPVTIVLDVD